MVHASWIKQTNNKSCLDGSPGACWLDSACDRLLEVAGQALLLLYPSPDCWSYQWCWSCQHSHPHPKEKRQISTSACLSKPMPWLLMTACSLSLSWRETAGTTSPWSVTNSDSPSSPVVICLFSQVKTWPFSFNVKPVFSLYSLYDILVISVLRFWLTPEDYQLKSQNSRWRWILSSILES